MKDTGSKPRASAVDKYETGMASTMKPKKDIAAPQHVVIASTEVTTRVASVFQAQPTLLGPKSASLPWEIKLRIMSQLFTLPMVSSFLKRADKETVSGAKCARKLVMHMKV